MNNAMQAYLPRTAISCRTIGATTMNAELSMNRLSLRNNRLKLQTSGKFTHHFRGICGTYRTSNP